MPMDAMRPHASSSSPHLPAPLAAAEVPEWEVAHQPRGARLSVRNVGAGVDASREAGEAEGLVEVARDAVGRQ